jgi:hypothetical protein
MQLVLQLRVQSVSWGMKERPSRAISNASFRARLEDVIPRERGWRTLAPALAEESPDRIILAAYNILNISYAQFTT